MLTRITGSGNIHVVSWTLFERANGMTTTAAAAEYKSNIGLGFTLADAYYTAYLGVEATGAEAEDVEQIGVEQRQALNARMAEWYGIG